MAHVTLGLDLGGTNLHVGTLQDDQFKDLGVFPFAHKLDFQDEMNAIATFCASLGVKFDRVTLATAGFINVRDQKIFDSVNFPGIAGPAVKRLGELLNVPISIVNDADAAALGVCHELSIDNAVVLTLGTGVGSGVIRDGNIFVGAQGFTAELGHLPISEFPSAVFCNCGSRYCIEAHWGTAGLLSKAKWGPKSPKEMFETLNQLEPTTKIHLIELMARLILTAGIAYGIDRFIITGGTSPIIKSWEENLKSELNKLTGRSLTMFEPRIEFIESKRNVGARGACYYK